MSERTRIRTEMCCPFVNHSGTRLTNWEHIVVQAEVMV